MKTRQLFSWSKTDFFWVAVSLVLLLPCLYYPYIGAANAVDVTLSPGLWEVFSAVPCPAGKSNCLYVGDRLLSIDGLEYREYLLDRLRPPFAGVAADGTIPVQLIRDGVELKFRALVRLPRTSLFARLAEDITPVVLLPLILWLMGTVAVLFLRPRDERWFALVLFSYVNALWLAAGQVSAYHAGGSSVVFHLFVWFFLPLSAHLHLILPNSLLDRRRRKALLAFFYGSAALLSALDSLYLLDDLRAYYFWSVLIGIAVPLALFAVRLFLPLEPAVKLANRIMLYGMILGLGPFVLFYGLVTRYYAQITTLVSDLRLLYPWYILISAVCLLIFPMSYIYAIYKHHLGALEFRANRLLGVYSYMALSTVCYVLVFFVISSWWSPINGGLLAPLLTASLLFVSVTPFLRDRFQTLVDRHVFGIRHSPEEVIDLVSERIPTAFDRAVLARVIAEEILPALLIRQSALYLLDETRVETLYEQALPAGEPEPTAEELRGILAKSGRYLPPDGEGTRHAWVRLVVPLAIQGKTVGVWLIGRRDPDDFFPVSDIHLLSTVANQIAPMVENIRLYERAQQEIAQRKAAEEEIRRSEERFRTLFEATLEGIAIVRNEVILEVNHALLGIFGYAPGELIGRKLSDLVSGSGADLDDVPREGIGYKSDGTPVHIEVAGKKYVFQGEDVTVIAIRDIAQRKRDEAENKMLQRQLLLSQKMEAIGRLSAGVAHDFNNCLLAIFGYSDLLLDRYAGDAFLGRNVTGIKEAGQRAAALTKQLLAFARRQPLETRVLDLNPVVANLEKMLHRLLGEDISLSTSLHPEVGKIRVDAGQIEQVIVNLAVNARQAMPSGGRLAIRTMPLTVRADGDSPAPHNVPPGGYVLLTVTDTGIGMDAETQARIFEPFFSTKGEGTGLGLATAYGIVKQSGGHIFVDSAPGQGACFSIYLPVSREAETPRVVAAGPAADTGSETILLVEDEDDVRKVLHQVLIGKGYRVMQAASGDEALAISRLHRGGIHLLLTDVTMPRMKGSELADRLLRERPQTRVIYMSGYNEESLPTGEAAWTCLQKPFSPQTLTQAVRAILDTSTEERQPKAATA